MFGGIVIILFTKTHTSFNLENTHTNVMESKKQGGEECRELKTIKYKSMLMTGSAAGPETVASTDITALETYLEAETVTNGAEPWCKLNKTIKLKKLTDFATTTYRDLHHLADEDVAQLVHFFRDCLDKKKLVKVKDVLYNKDEGIILDIPCLAYTKAKKHFTLKKLDKRASTLKSLPKQVATPVDHSS